MITISFRLKILLTMFLLVVGTTGATLFVTARKVKATYQKLFQEQFDTQIDYFSEKQEFRLSSIKEKCAELAKSVRLREALIEGDVKDIYKNADQELESLRARTTPGKGRADDRRTTQRTASPPNRSGPARRNSSDLLSHGQADRAPIRNYLVLDAKGRVLKPSGPAPGAGPRGVRRQFEDKLAVLGQAMDKFDFQQVGYLAPEIETNRVQLNEVIVTKINDPNTAETLGALVLRVPLFDPEEQTMNEMSAILSGIWLESEIHSRTIPEAMREPVARLVAGELQRSTQGRDTFEVELEGEPHRVFYRLLNPDSPFPPAYQICLYSLKPALKTQNDLRLAILGFSAMALAFGFYLSFVLSHKLTVSVRELDTATAQVQKGNLQVKVPVRSRDDIGRLVRSFNEMVDGLALKEKYHNVLNMVADKDVAEQLMSGSVALGGELREVSVLFCDIRGFTTLTRTCRRRKSSSCSTNT